MRTEKELEDGFYQAMAMVYNMEKLGLTADDDIYEGIARKHWWVLAHSRKLLWDSVRERNEISRKNAEGEDLEPLEGLEQPKSQGYSSPRVPA